LIFAKTVQRGLKYGHRNKPKVYWMEATTSIRIRGTRTNIEEVVKKKDEVNPDNGIDQLKVNNFIWALNESYPIITFAHHLYK